MKKKFMCVAAAVICLSCGVSMIANANGPGVQNPDTGLTTTEMVESLYAAESNEDLKKCVLDSSLILTGERMPSDYYGYLYIGKYRDPAVFRYASVSVILGTDSLAADVSDGYTMLLKRSDYPTETAAEENRTALRMLYDATQEVKANTAGMSDTEKISYINEYIRQRLRFKAPSTAHPATCLRTGIADCDGTAGLCYILGKNCGLDISIKVGTLDGTGHAWNEIVLDGNRYVADIVQGRMLVPAETIAAYGYVEQ